MYPCDRGTRSWQWFHHFQAESGKTPCCIYCGAMPGSGIKAAVTNASQPGDPS